MIRIALVDDHAIIREALRYMLERDKEIQIVGESGDGESALRMIDTLLPDLVVMDISMPGLSGVEVTRHLLLDHPHIKVLALSTHLDQNIIQEMLEAGASGYISKSAIGGQLLQGIRALMEGHRYLSPEVAALLADGLLKPSPTPGGGTLSRRERQIASLLAQGKSAADVANDLNISSGTVDVHRRNLMRKLNLHGAVELTRYAIRTGLISA